MEHVLLNDISYEFARDFKDDHKIRQSFNELTETVFGFNLETWYQSGYWTGRYIPYSLLHKNEVVSNISVSIMEFDIENTRKKGIQLGTVMTRNEYRHQGLNRFIMDRVMDEWSDRCDFIYLFANNSVLDFYPKFNFEKIDEYQYSKSLSASQSPTAYRRLDMEDSSDVAVLRDTVNQSIPVSKISMRDNEALIMFYCLSFKKESIFYIEKFNTIVVAEFEGDTLYLNDVFSRDAVELDDIIQAMSNNRTKRVVLGFTPMKNTGFDVGLSTEADTLFMLKDKGNFFKNKHWMFPILSHA